MIRPVDMGAPVVGALVWVAGLKGPTAYKRPAGGPLVGGAVGEVLATHPLTAEEYALKITVLEQRYPPPPKIEP